MTRRLDITRPPSALLIRMATQRYTKLPLFILYMAFLAVADVVSVKHHAYADDTQLYIRCQTQEATIQLLTDLVLKCVLKRATLDRSE